MTTLHNVHAQMIRTRYLKDLFGQWRGLLAGYDEGLVKGDAVLAAAVWRNVFKGNPEVDLRKLAAVVAYVRSGLKRLDGMTDEEVGRGEVSFGSPKALEGVVRERSRGLDERFGDEEGKVVAAKR